MANETTVLAEGATKTTDSAEQSTTEATATPKVEEGTATDQSSDSLEDALVASRKKPEGAEGSANEGEAEGDDADTDKAEDEDKDGDEKTAEVDVSKITVPEGFELDASTAEELVEVAKDLKLNQEGAQKITDLGTKLVERIMQKQVNAVNEARTEWREQQAADKEFGGNNLDKNLAVAVRALDEFGTPELRTLLEETGLGDHPEIIRVLYRAGKAISEDTLVGGKNSDGKPKTLEERLYGSG